MEKIKITFGKDKTAIIKGVAIIFMIVLHVFGGSGWYESCYDLPLNHNERLIHFMQSFQICVGIYVFMIGYGYAFSEKKDFLYSIKHIKQLLIVFWSILFFFALPAGYKSIEGGKSLFLNMFGIEETLTWVSWFVFLYIWVMITMPFIGRFIDKKPYIFSVLSVLLSLLTMVMIYMLVPNFGQYKLWKTLFVCLGWTPTIILGYFCAKRTIFQKMVFPKHWGVSVGAIIIIAVVICLKSVFAGISILNFDIIYAPIIITCILIVFSQNRFEWLSRVLSEFGDKSVYMWFVHALFFTASTRPVYQQFVMVSDNLWIISFWTIILSYILSVLIKKIVEL